MRKKTLDLILMPLAAGVILAATSCTKEEPKKAAAIDAAPLASAPGALALLPEEPKTGAVLRAIVTGDGASLRWERNGEPLMAESDTLPTAGFRKGDVIKVIAGPPGAERSAETVLLNSPPVIRSVRMSPSPFYKGNDITADVEAWDPDGDSVRYRYEWTVNGETVYGADERTLSAASYGRGDEVAVNVTAADSEASSAAFRAVAGKAANAPPKFTSAPPVDFTARFIYAPVIADPDGDTIVLSLEKGPEGMSVVNGIVEWRAGADLKGSFEVTVAADDGNGARVLQTFELKVGE